MTSLDFDAVMLEYHSEANRRKVEELLGDFFLIGGEIRGLHRGTLKFLHRRLVEAAGLLTPRRVSESVAHGRGDPGAKEAATP
jgi:hypothetical protein